MVVLTQLSYLLEIFFWSFFHQKKGHLLCIRWWIIQEIHSNWIRWNCNWFTKFSSYDNLDDTPLLHVGADSLLSIVHTRDFGVSIHDLLRVVVENIIYIMATDSFPWSLKRPWCMCLSGNPPIGSLKYWPRYAHIIPTLGYILHQWWIRR